jgi:phospholipase/carboxylesterase
MMSTNERKDNYLTPKAEHTSTMIFLHGLADNADAFVEHYKDKDAYNMSLPNTKIVCLNAKEREVTIALNQVLKSWYNVKGLPQIEEDYESQSGLIDHDQLNDSTDDVLKVVKEEAKIFGGDCSKIVVAGISQGACVAYNTLFRSGLKLGGILGLSGHTPLVNETSVTETVKKVPIFSYHGLSDNVVPEELHKQGTEKLRKLGCDVTYYSEKDLGHSISRLEIERIKKFFKDKKLVPSKSSSS